MKRRMLAILLVVFMIVTSLVGCSGNNNEPKKEDAAEPTQAEGTKETDKTNDDADVDNSSDTDLTSEKIYVGLSCAITGDVPLEGDMVSKTVKMVVDEVNAAGGINGAELALVIEDDSNVANTAINVMSKFVSDKKIVLSIGPHRSASVLAVEAIAKEGGLPMITGGSSKTFYELGNEYLFRIRGCDTLVASNAAKFCVENVGKKIGLIYNNDDYGNGAKQVIEEYIAGTDAELVAEEAHTTGDKDMTGQLLACKEAGADVIIGWTHDDEAAVITRQYKELGLDETIAFVGCSSWANTAFYKLLNKGLSDGIYATVDFTVTNPDPTAIEFTAKFKEKYNEEPENMAGCYYDAALLAVDALKRAADSGEVTRESVREALANTTEPISGNQGQLYISENGMDFIHQVVIIKNENDVPVFQFAVTE